MSQPVQKAPQKPAIIRSMPVQVKSEPTPEPVKEAHQEAASEPEPIALDSDTQAAPVTIKKISKKKKTNPEA